MKSEIEQHIIKLKMAIVHAKEPIDGCDCFEVTSHLRCGATSGGKKGSDDDLKAHNIDATIDLLFHPIYRELSKIKHDMHRGSIGNAICKIADLMDAISHD